MLFYLPLEPYKERYTIQLAAPLWGWQERRWREHGISYHRVNGQDGISYHRVNGQDSAGRISTGQVLDASGRSRWAMSQVASLLNLLGSGALTSEDTILLDDFWHPGVEALPYAFHLHGVRPKVYAFLYAQSVDQFDFTYPMRSWMRHFERGIGEFLDGIFVANSLLKDLVVCGGIAPADKVHVVGLVFDSEEVAGRMPVHRPTKQNRVVFSSRWDKEKNPEFFLQVAAQVARRVPEAKFIVCTSSSKVRSNQPWLLDLLETAREVLGPSLKVRVGLTKEAYYNQLCQAKIQFNCADQDWVSFTLLEASVAGCYPIYPDFRSFPETLRGEDQYLYQHKDVGAAVEKLVQILNRDDLWTPEAIQGRNWIHSRYNGTWQRMAQVMGLLPGQPVGPYEDAGNG